MSYSGNKKIILHIGITKTGSTALQKFLVDNKELLSEQGAGYYNSSVISSPFQPYKNAEALKFKSMLLCGEGRWADEKLVEEDLSKLKEKGISMIFVSHDLAVTSSLCDRIMVFRKGKCVEEGETRRLIEDPKEEYTKELLSSVLRV